MSVDELRERYLPALARAASRARAAPAWRASWSPASTRPPSARRPVWAPCGPGPRTSVPGLVLAGAWTATGWPATLEGAVLSGHAAATPRSRRSGWGRRAWRGGSAGRASRARARRPARPARPRAPGGSTGAMSELLVAAPMRIEAALISSAARGAHVRKTGMGPGRSKAAAGELALARARAMLVLGFCGGLDAGSVPGEVIVARAGVRGRGRRPRARAGQLRPVAGSSFSA